MIHTKKPGRIFFGIAIAGIGLLQLAYKGFRPLILPLPPEATESISALIYLLGAYFTVSGILIALGKQVCTTALLLGTVLLLFLVFGQLPNRLANHPELLPYWTDAIKLLAISGGAFALATAYPQVLHGHLAVLSRIAAAGKYFFAIMLCLFGFVHFLYAEMVSNIVPPYIPFKLFFTYISGAALIGSGLAIFTGYRMRMATLGMAVILMVWLLSLHLYYAVRYPDSESIIGVMVCLAFCGTSLVLGTTPDSQKTPSV